MCHRGSGSHRKGLIGFTMKRGKRNENEGFLGFNGQLFKFGTEIHIMNNRCFILLSKEAVSQVVSPLMRVGRYLGGVTGSTPANDT